MVCSSGRPHVLLLPYPAQGHVNPMMQLGKRLAAYADVRVTLATMQHVHSKILRSQQALSQPISDQDLDFHLVGIPDGLQEGDDREAWSQELLDLIHGPLEEAALEVVHMLALQGCPVTYIVGDFFLRWTCTLARRAVLPEFVFWPQSAAVFSICFHVDSIIASGYNPFEPNGGPTYLSKYVKDVLSSFIPRALEIHEADLPFMSGMFGKVALDWMQEILRYRFGHIGEAKGVIINSFEALETRVYESLHVSMTHHQRNAQGLSHHIQSLSFLGPLVPLPYSQSNEDQLMERGSNTKDSISGASLWEEEVDECMQWLDEQPPASVVLVAFGSIRTMSIDELRELATGLEASGQRVLWVIRRDSIKLAMQDDPMHKSAATIVELEKGLPEGFLERNKQTCKVVRWAPQTLVLGHVAVGGFFSHCGWNSILESMCLGVPVLGWPWLLDQATNCWLVSHVWQTGITLPRNLDNQASSTDIASSLHELMQGTHSHDMRARAKELRESGRQALLDSPRSFQSFLDKIPGFPHMSMPVSMG